MTRMKKKVIISYNQSKKIPEYFQTPTCASSLFQNIISWVDRCIAKNFASKEYCIDKIGPSFTNSKVGATSAAKGEVFHEKAYEKNRKEIHHVV